MIKKSFLTYEQFYVYLMLINIIYILYFSTSALGKASLSCVYWLHVAKHTHYAFVTTAQLLVMTFRNYVVNVNEYI